MYPTLYHLLLDLLGIDFAPLIHVKTFGSFVVLAFIGAFFVIYYDFKEQVEIGSLEFVHTNKWYNVISKFFLFFALAH